MTKTNTWKGLAVAAAVAAAGGVLPACMPTPAAAQANPTIASIPEPMAETLQARITAIDPQTRKVTLQGATGRSVTVTAGPMVRLEMLQVGDTVNARFYRSVAFDLSSGMGAPPDAAAVVLGQQAQAPGGVAVALTRMSALVVGKHPASNSLDVVSPGGGGVYTVHVTDPARVAMLQQVNVGDTITAVVSDAIAVSIDKAQRNWLTGQ
ncbi:MAG: hypothetical protein IRZ13_00590 [Acetobacteraceae bacterium]|nr:hypothetical protein [Acetobacteraceae bacterium]